MAIKAADVKKLRDKTGVGMMECKKALTKAEGDFDKAIEVLRKRGLEVAKKKSARAAKEGVVHSYIHGNGRVGVLIEVNCETDFVARTDDFKDLVKNLCMQVAAVSPQWVDRDEVPPEIIEKEKVLYKEMALKAGKPEKILDKIAAGKLEKFFSDVCLIDQPYIKDEKHKMKVKQVVETTIAKLGENIKVRRFVRFQLGEDA